MKKIIILILSITLQSCLFETANNIQVKIVNTSKNEVYVGELYECDSCGIMQDVRLYCSHGNDTTFFPRLLKGGDSVIMRTKVHSIQKIDVINADSLEEYCRNGCNYNITNKQWVKVLSQNIDIEKKTCRIVIK